MKRKGEKKKRARRKKGGEEKKAKVVFAEKKTVWRKRSFSSNVFNNPATSTNNICLNSLKRGNCGLKNFGGLASWSA